MGELLEITYGISFLAMTFDLGPRSEVKSVFLWIYHTFRQYTCHILEIRTTITVISSKQTSKQTNKQTCKQTNKQTSKQTNKQICEKLITEINRLTNDKVLNVYITMSNRDLLCVQELLEITYGISFSAMTFDL